MKWKSGAISQLHTAGANAIISGSTYSEGVASMSSIWKPYDILFTWYLMDFYNFIDRLKPWPVS